MTAAERALQMKTLDSALTVRAARDQQKRDAAEHDLQAALKELPDSALWELRRALDLVESGLSAETWGRP